MVSKQNLFRFHNATETELNENHMQILVAHKCESEQLGLDYFSLSNDRIATIYSYNNLKRTSTYRPQMKNQTEKINYELRIRENYWKSGIFPYMYMYIFAAYKLSGINEANLCNAFVSGLQNSYISDANQRYYGYQRI